MAKTIELKRVSGKVLERYLRATGNGYAGTHSVDKGIDYMVAAIEDGVSYKQKKEFHDRLSFKKAKSVVTTREGAVPMHVFYAPTTEEKLVKWQEPKFEKAKKEKKQKTASGPRVSRAKVSVCFDTWVSRLGVEKVKETYSLNGATGSFRLFSAWCEKHNVENDINLMRFYNLMKKGGYCVQLGRGRRKSK